MDFKDEENKETAALMSDEVITKAVKDFQVSSKVHTIYSRVIGPSQKPCLNMKN